MRWIILACVASSLWCAHAQDAEQAKVNTAVEALTRLENVNLDEKPAVKAAVERVLARTRGTPNFVKLVKHFKLTGHNAGLIEVAANHPRDESGVEALRLVLASTDLKPLQDALAANSHRTNTAGLVEALGHTKDKQAAPLLEPLVNDEARDSAVRRAAVRALAQTPEGAGALLRLAKEDKLPENLKFTAASELASARWLEVKNEAAKVLPLPATGNAEPLPAMAELVKMTGDAARGAQVYRRETVACISCHQVRGEGRDVGPALTEIGSKLPKEALVEAILDPNAGISFGFEAWQVELKSGDEAFGLKVSETADEVAIKDTGGIVTRYKKSDIAKMQQAKNSIMPAGLQATLSTQEFVDLIEYLASLKKAQP